MNKDNYSVTVDVDIADINEELKPASEMRERLNDEAIQNYADILNRMPPVKLIHDPTTNAHWLVDGCHTVHAALKCKRKKIQAIVKTGSYVEAFKEASHANDMHGVHVTNADKRHRVLVALKHPEISTLSTREISKVCGVDHKVVLRLRPDSVGAKPQLNGKTEKDSKAEKVVGKDGKLYPARKPKKPKSPTAPAANGTTPTDSENPKKGNLPLIPDSEIDVTVVEEDSPSAPVSSEPSGNGKGTHSKPVPDGPESDIALATDSPINWLARWDDEERLIMEHYRAWPENVRHVFAFKLLGLAQKIRTLYHEDEIKDRSSESLI